MTNSSPQEPQNSVPERKRRFAGLTTDEIIAILIAFSTISGILFWSWSSKINNFVGNLGLGRQKSSLSANNIGIGIGRINADSQVAFGTLESDRDSLTRDGLKMKDEQEAMASRSSKFDPDSKIEANAYQLDTTSKLGALGVGTAALPGLKNRTNINPGLNSDNIITDNPNRTSSPGATSDSIAGSGTTDAPGTTPDGTADSRTTDTPGITPDKTEMPDDVTPTYWAYPFVKQMSDQALVADFTETQDFEPDKLITRASMATLISQAFNDQPEVQQIKKFQDVTNENAIAADIDKAVRTGFMQGYSDEEFRPLDNIPRYQVLVTLATGLGLKPSQNPEQILQKFGDGTDLPDWAKEQVAAAAEAGLIVNRPGVADDSLSPNASATRAEVAAMIHQALVKAGKLEPLESEYILQP